MKKSIKNFKESILKVKSKVIVTLHLFSFILLKKVYAGPGDGLTSDADTKFNLIVNTIAGYGYKFGLLIIFYGAIQIGLSFKNDNPDGKVSGARTAIAGLIVASVSFGADKFFI